MITETAKTRKEQNVENVYLCNSQFSSFNNPVTVMTDSQILHYL